MSRSDAGAEADPGSETVLEVEDLAVEYAMEDGPNVQAVRDVSFSIEAGRTFGLVGESGCGKTTAARALIDLLDENGSIDGGSVYKDGRDLTTLSDTEMQDVRWAEIATIPQNVMNSLNPVETVGSQIVDVIRLHTDRSREAAETHAIDLFERVGLDPGRMRDYPHEFSGGMLQRAVIAMAMSCDPDLIIADEPTTALDVVVQDEILTELADLQDEFGVSILIISHDIGVMAEVCDDIGVMYAGEMMEIGTAEDVFVEPSNPYTMGLENSFPNIEDPDRELVSIPGTAPDLTEDREACPFVERCPFAEAECREVRPQMYQAPGKAEHRSRCHFVDDVERLRSEAADPATWGGGVEAVGDPEPGEQTVLTVDGLRKYFDNSQGLVDTLLGRSPTPVKAVDDVSFEVKDGEMFGIVGESGCGKSTLGRTVLDLETPTDGTITFEETSGSGRKRSFRETAQIIFQDPFESLNPRLTVRQTLMEPLSLLGERRSYRQRLEIVEDTLAEVGLSPPDEYMDRFPEQLSGGELQRVSIARALVVDPEFLLADEPVSMLDVSIRASILNIFRRLRRDEDLSLSIISHDLSLVRNVCDRTAVMYLGEFVEVGDTDAIVEDPKHPYSEALVESVPIPDPTRERSPAEISGEPPSARDPPSGCRFHTRCPKVIPPEEYEFDQERFRELMDLRLAVADEAIRLDRARDRADDPDDPASVAAAIRNQRFSGGFQDPAVAGIVEEALGHVVEEEWDVATERLAEAFETPCETDRPELREVEDGRLVGCHLY